VCPPNLVRLWRMGFSSGPPPPRHIYWEARFAAAQRRDRWRLIRSVLDHRYADCDRLVERVVERTLFSFRTNKRIFHSVMAPPQGEQWQRMVRGLGARSRYPL